MAESINFEGVGVAESTPRNYVTPGYRKLQFGTVEAISSTQKGTPGLQFNLVNETGGTLKTDFWLSAGALPRLQYLHKSLFGALLTKAMTPGELADYFNKNINGRKLTTLLLEVRNLVIKLTVNFLTRTLLFLKVKNSLKETLARMTKRDILEQVRNKLLLTQHMKLCLVQMILLSAN